MAAFEELFIQCGGPIGSEARALAEDLGMKCTEHHGRFYLSRAAGSGIGKVGGEVFRNQFTQEESEEAQAPAFDGYDTVFEIWTTDGSSAEQRSEALRIFRELVARRPDTAMVLTHDVDLIVAAHP